MNRLNSLCGAVAKNDMKAVTEYKGSDSIFDLPPTAGDKSENPNNYERYGPIVFYD